MKQLLTIIFAFLGSISAFAQSFQEIATGTGYQKQSFINLTTGTEKQVNNTAWDIAFTVFGAQDAGIFINESSGSSMGQPLPQVELYYTLSDDFAAVPDPAALGDNRLYNSEITWQYGAFNEVRNPNNPADFGWGEYSFMTNQVIGGLVYVVKLRDGQYRKIKIESLSLVNGVQSYTIKYANLDGTGETTKVIAKNPNTNQALAYFSFGTGDVVDVEPVSTGWDFVYCRYNTFIPDPATGEPTLYNVTGLLNGKGVTVAEADGFDPSVNEIGVYADSFQTKLDVVGSDWKSFSGTTWSIDEDRVYFVQTAAGVLWKLHFVDFEGSSTGKAVFEKTNLGIFSSVSDARALGLQLLTYPNPSTDVLYVSLEVPATLAQAGQLQVTDMAGRQVLQRKVTLREGLQVFELPVAQMAQGNYHLNLVVGTAENISLGQFIKQ
jgi:HmuY protein